MSRVVQSLQHPIALDDKGRVKWDEKGLSLNARLAVEERPEVVEMHGVDGWLAFWHASKETGFMPTAPMGL